MTFASFPSVLSKICRLSRARTHPPVCITTLRKETERNRGRESGGDEKRWAKIALVIDQGSWELCSFFWSSFHDNSFIIFCKKKTLDPVLIPIITCPFSPPSNHFQSGFLSQSAPPPQSHVPSVPLFLSLLLLFFVLFLVHFTNQKPLDWSIPHWFRPSFLQPRTRN